MAKNYTLEEAFKKILKTNGYADEEIFLLVPQLTWGVNQFNKQERNKINPAVQELTGMVVSLLCERTGRKFKLDNPGTVANLRSRINEGAKWEQFKAVIDHKVKEWKGTEMDKFLRPATLFNRTKFYNYLEEARIAYQENKGIKPKKEEPRKVVSQVKFT